MSEVIVRRLGSKPCHRAYVEDDRIRDGALPGNRPVRFVEGPITTVCGRTLHSTRRSLIIMDAEPDACCKVAP